MRNSPGNHLLSGIIAVIRADSPDMAATIARGLDGTSVASVEITMTVPDAAELIRGLSQELSVPIGAGTVTEKAAVEVAAAAGARFIVSPGFQSDVVQAALRAQMPVVPGALTPTEIMRAWAAGATAVKVFPVSSVGGPSYVRSIRAPLPHIPLVVSGGIRPDEVGSYLEAGALGVSLGSSLVDVATAAGGDVGAVRQMVNARLSRDRT